MQHRCLPSYTTTTVGRPLRWSVLALTVCLTLAWLGAGCAVIDRGAPAPIAVGLVAPLSGPSAASGEAIQRGMLLAIDEVNRDGGVLGRPLALVTRDVANDPPAGVAALHELRERHGIVALFGGIFSPVMLAQLDALHALEIPLINPWGSVTGITQNGRQPNYAFRVSVSDDTADEFLGRYTLDVVGAARPAIMADTSAWGDSNVVGLRSVLAARGVPPAGIERFAQGETTMLAQVERLRAAGADAIILVANAPEGACIVRALAAAGWRPPVVSHWGITGGTFVEAAGIDYAEGIYTLQTFSFHGVRSPRAEAVLRAHHQRFGTRQIEDIRAPVGVAHGYDGIQLLARAIRQAGTTDGPRVRTALESLGPYDGLVKRYDPAFTLHRHDALRAEDYLMAVWRNGRLVPAPEPRLPP